MRRTAISKPARGLGASGRSRRPFKAIWYQSCTTSGRRRSAKAVASRPSATAAPGTSCCTWIRCRPSASASSTPLQSGENSASAATTCNRRGPSPSASASSIAATWVRSTVPRMVRTTSSRSAPPA
ncbi:hypothetical protein G6F56_013837 [Rhizopus delemar]|nr:hypothetical protein G6F56_013837 [Rhizopus delemar]